MTIQWLSDHYPITIRWLYLYFLISWCICLSYMIFFLSLLYERKRENAFTWWKPHKSVNNNKNIAKGTTDPRVGFCLPKFKQVQKQIFIKFHLQNLDQASTSKSLPNISLSIKHQQKKTGWAPAANLAWTSTSISWPNLVLNIWTKV